MGDKMTSGIYCIENLINGKMYIGKTKNIEKRRREHFSELRNNHHDNDHLQNSWNKYSEINFFFYIIEECQQKDLDKLEIYYIKEWNTKAPSGYNLTDGGDGLNNPSYETRRKISENHADFSGKNHPMYGKNQNDESKRKNRESQLGVKSYIFGKKKQNSISRYFGISLRKLSNAYRITIRIDGRTVEIGERKDEKEAAKMYDKYIIEHNLPNPLNFPEDYSKERRSDE